MMRRRWGTRRRRRRIQHKGESAPLCWITRLHRPAKNELDSVPTALGFTTCTLYLQGLTILWFTLFGNRPLFSGADNKIKVHIGSVRSKKKVLIFSVLVRGPK